MVSFCFYGESRYMEEFITLREASKEWGISERRIRTLCMNGRISGASKIGNIWVIPEGTEKPVDNRIKSGKYIKNKLNGQKLSK